MHTDKIYWVNIIIRSASNILQNSNFVSWFVWVRNVASYYEGRIVSAWKQSAQEYSWTCHLVLLGQWNWGRCDELGM
jgi:hypothetical protein